MTAFSDLTKEPTYPFQSFQEATVYLEDLALRLGVRHLSYWLVTNNDGAPDDVVWLSTYDPNYMSFYMGGYTPLGDPGFAMAIGKGAPIDWTQWQEEDAVSKTLLETAARFGITKYGISLPLRDSLRNDILFSINIESNEVDWPTRRLQLLATYWPFVELMHARVWPLVQKGKIEFDDRLKGHRLASG